MTGEAKPSEVKAKPLGGEDKTIGGANEIAVVRDRWGVLVGQGICGRCRSDVTELLSDIARPPRRLPLVVAA